MTSSNQAPATRQAVGMEPAAVGAHLQSRLGEAVLDVGVAFGQVTITLEPAALPEAARLCKESPELDFDFYDFNAGVDLGEDGFAVVTHLYSLRHRHHVLLRVVAPGGRTSPTVPTLTHLYRGANWHERETYDMFGIDFEGHPGLLPRILTVENFEGFPLRKDFLLSTREAKPWPGLKEPKEIGADDDVPAIKGDTPPGAVGADEKAKVAQDRADKTREKAAELRAQTRPGGEGTSPDDAGEEQS